MDVDVPLEGASDSDSASSSSTSSSSSSASGPPVRHQRQPVPEMTAEEVTGALHRHMWHVSITDPDIDSDVIRTACGRKFPRTSIIMVADLTLQPGQSLCSHVGCRKGWRAVGAI